jgi:hypothetical protein
MISKNRDRFDNAVEKLKNQTAESISNDSKLSVGYENVNSENEINASSIVKSVQCIADAIRSIHNVLSITELLAVIETKMNSMFITPEFYCLNFFLCKVRT